jgi:hypothetical protein
MTPHFRELAKKISPTWLTRFTGLRILYVIGLHVDALIHCLVLAIKMRMPGITLLPSAANQGDPTSAIPYVGRDRSIVRGSLETLASYTSALLHWTDLLRFKGQAFTLLDRLHASLGGVSTMRLAIVTQSGNRYNRAGDGTRTVSSVTWNWDGHSELWARFWVLVYDSDNVVSPEFTTELGSGRTFSSTDGPSAAIGIRATGTIKMAALAQEIRTICQTWKPAHMVLKYIIWTWDESLFNSLSPNGTWARWKNRNPNVAYIGGDR